MPGAQASPASGSLPVLPVMLFGWTLCDLTHWEDPSAPLCKDTSLPASSSCSPTHHPRPKTQAAGTRALPAWRRRFRPGLRALAVPNHLAVSTTKNRYYITVPLAHSFREIGKINRQQSAPSAFPRGVAPSPSDPMWLLSEEKLLPSPSGQAYSSTEMNSYGDK